MGTFAARIGVSNGDGQEPEWVSARIGTNATSAVLPASFLRGRLGLVPTREMTFTFADGRERPMPVGNALFRVNGVEAHSPVVFGEEGQHLVGATTLQSLGLIADTTNHELIPAPKLYI